MPNEARPMNQKLDRFTNEDDKNNFLQWERHLRATARINQWTDDQTVMAAKAAMHGQASDLAQALPDTVRDCRECEPAGTLEAFYGQLRKLFVSPAHERLARAQFDNRVQGAKEPIRVFHGLLLALFKDGHAKIQEAWRDNLHMPVPAPYLNRREPVGSRSQMLIQHFISGLRDKVIRDRLLDQQVAQGHEFNSYTDVLAASLAYLGNVEQSEEDQRRIRQGGPRGRIREYDYLKGVRGDREEPMEIGALQDRRGGGNACRLHPEAAHTDQQCIVQRRKKAANAGKGPVTSTQTFHAKPADGKKDRFVRKTKVDRSSATCRVCKGVGHFGNECPSSSRSQGTTRQRVNAVADGDQEDDDDQILVVDDEYDDEQEEEYEDSDEEEDQQE